MRNSLEIFSFKKTVIYFWLCWVSVALWTSSRGEQGLLSLGVLRLLSAAASRRRAQALGRAGFSSCSSRALEHRLSCAEVRAIFPDQGSNLCLLYCQEDSSPLSHQGRPKYLTCTFLIICFKNIWTEKIVRDRGARPATVHGVARIQTQLSTHQAVKLCFLNPDARF